MLMRALALTMAFVSSQFGLGATRADDVVVRIEDGIGNGRGVNTPHLPPVNRSATTSFGARNRGPKQRRFDCARRRRRDGLRKQQRRAARRRRNNRRG